MYCPEVMKFKSDTPVHKNCINVLKCLPVADLQELNILLFHILVRVWYVALLRCAPSLLHTAGFLFAFLGHALPGRL